MQITPCKVLGIQEDATLFNVNEVELLQCLSRVDQILSRFQLGLWGFRMSRHHPFHPRALLITPICTLLFLVVNNNLASFLILDIIGIIINLVTVNLIMVIPIPDMLYMLGMKLEIEMQRDNQFLMEYNLMDKMPVYELL